MLKEKLLHIVQESLPGIQAEEFKNFFEKYGEMEEKLKNEEGINENLREENKILDDTISELESIDRDVEAMKSERASINAAKLELEALQRKQEVDKLTYQLEAEKSSNAKVIELTQVVFKNHYVRKDIFKSYNDPSGYPINENISETPADQL